MPNPNPMHNPTDGKGSVAFIQLSGTNLVAFKTVGAAGVLPANPILYNLTLSLGSNGGKVPTCQLTPALVDVGNNLYPGSLVLTSVANASSGTTVYTGTITGGAANAFVGMTVTIAGFLTAANNGTFAVTASNATTLTLANAAGVSETHAATANAQVGSVLYRSYGDPANKAGSAPSWYKPSRISGYDENIASVSSTGLITSRAVGQTVVEVSFPMFDNTIGNDPSFSGETLGAQPKEFIYVHVLVNVIV